MINLFHSQFRVDKFLVFLLLIVTGVILIRTAWVGDDVYITLRTVDNAVHGYGLTWNVDERVQAYTHPLWMFLMIPIYVVTRNGYFTALFLSFLFTILTLLIVTFESNAVLTLLLLLLSKAFMDFSVSGLENPATHFLLLVWVLYFLKKDDWKHVDLLILALITSIALLNRMDTALFFAPSFVDLLYRRHSAQAIGSLALGFLPFVLWEIFSLFYYGFLFPNTAYAKLGTGITRIDLIRQGLIYYADSFSRDPLTLTVIVVGLALVFWRGKLKEYLVAVGMILYMIYIINIGGDFMSGRFFSTPFLISILLLSRFLERKSARLKAIVVVCCMLISLTVRYPSLFPSNDPDPYTEYNIQTGIYDERAYYYQNTGLLPMLNSNGNSLMSHPWVKQGLRLRGGAKVIDNKINVGFMGYFAGPRAHIIDPYALCDPLLARLPALKHEKWRIGHFKRAVPDGYFTTLKTGQNHIKDPSLAIYYDRLSLIIRGPLQNRDRLYIIWKMNTGQYNYLISQYHS